MTDHPYKHLPKHCFWRVSIAEVPQFDVDPVVSPKFTILKSDRVVTAGSCFAQHISAHLKKSGFSYFVTETPHPLIGAHLLKDYGYGIFSARYGNIYTARQLVQLLERAYGLFKPSEDIWIRPDGRFIDPFRPQIQPNGFASRAEYDADRIQHYRAVRAAIENLNVFVFTLGLTEAWISKADGAVYPLCPGVAGGQFHRSCHEFVNFSVSEVAEDLHKAANFIRGKNPSVKMVLTVSPVPLSATAESRSVLVSTTLSKSVLRVAADEIERQCNYIAYFPSYEIITGNFSRGAYFGDDLRSVTERGVDHVMRLFMKHYASGAPQNQSSPCDNACTALDETVRSHTREMERISKVMCDEELLDRKG